MNLFDFTLHATVLLIIGVGLWKEARNPVWNEMAIKYGVPWKRCPWFGAGGIRFWGVTEKKSVFKDISVDISHQGIGLYPAFVFKILTKSLLIPWEDLELVDGVREGPLVKVPSLSKARLQLQFKIIDSDIRFSIPNSFQDSVEEFINPNQ